MAQNTEKRKKKKTEHFFTKDLKDLNLDCLLFFQYSMKGLLPPMWL